MAELFGLPGLCSLWCLATSCCNRPLFTKLLRIWFDVKKCVNAVHFLTHLSQSWAFLMRIWLQTINLVKLYFYTIENRDFRFHSTFIHFDILQFHEKNCHFCGFCLHYFDRLQFHDKNSKLSLLFKLFWPTPISREKFRWYKWVNPGVIFLLAQQEHQDNF